ncbi:hypothetical protein TNIN_65961 [Trichonephila inaurata madagascariensis]|uniref:Uncharacterized protein n=1 Tax=Trichonephila inaurata madagascariensis TaxID=2747483 RepID=A0A8X6XWL6_9ARAC|nr:hypothetical protein TNIN_65961 [Trichonephila inaurata madagascariensis]
MPCETNSRTQGHSFMRNSPKVKDPLLLDLPCLHWLEKICTITGYALKKKPSVPFLSQTEAFTGVFYLPYCELNAPKKRGGKELLKTSE